MDNPIVHWAILLSAAFVAAIAQSITGFGLAMLALPLFLLVLPLIEALQVTMFLTFCLSILLFIRHRPFVPKPLFKYLAMGSFVGIL